MRMGGQRRITQEGAVRTMKMVELVRYDVPAEIISLWQKRESEVLLPLQEMTIKRHGLFDSGNLLIQAPTSSGKTFIGEMAAIQAAMRRKKVIYLVPLKALAEEKYLDFKEKYAPYGLQVIISTRDHRDFDRQLEEGAFSIAVVVYEKLAQLLVRRPERLGETALVIADELEILSDPERGALVEILLTRILRTGSRLIGLSAVIGGAEKLATWMQAQLVFSDRRPVELRSGVLFEGHFRYRTYNQRTEDTEELVDMRADSAWEIVAENVRAFAQAGESSLIFVKAKHESRRAAQLLTRRVDLDAASHTIAALRSLEPTRSRDYLMESLAQGIAFHNADLSPAERRIVEEGFRSGEILVMVSTSTLAVGLNMPARNVFITAEKWRYDVRINLPWKTPILRSEYENMGGRAGRYGANHPFGRSILIATSPFDAETLWRRYIDGTCEPIEPQLANESLEDHVLGLAASRFCRNDDELCRFMEQTLSAKWVWEETLTEDAIRFQFSAATNRVMDAGAMTRHPERGLFEATPFGLAVAAKGIHLSTAHELEAWIRESETRVWSNLDLILAGSVTQDARLLPVSLTAQEYERADYLAKLKRLTDREDIGVDVPLNRFRSGTLMPFFEEMRAIKTTLILNEWIDNVPTRELEERYHTMAGQVFAAADQLAWLIDATAAIASASGARAEFVERIRILAERVQYGVREDALPIARLTTPRLGRSVVLALAAHGLHTVENLTPTTPQLLAEWMKPADARRLHEWAVRQSESTQPVEVVSFAMATAPILIVDDKRPGEILLDGVQIRLQDRQYRLIHCLASTPGVCIPYDELYTKIWGNIVVEPNQMHFQKRKLLEAILEKSPARNNLITTIPKRGFVLNLSEDEVAFYPAVAATSDMPVLAGHG